MTIWYDPPMKVTDGEPKYYLLKMEYNNSITGDKTIGTVQVMNNKFVFEGDIDESANIFFNVTLRKLVDDYLRERAEYTEKPYIKRMEEKCFSGNIHDKHIKADEILCKLLKGLGYKKLIKLYEGIYKCYD